MFEQYINKLLKTRDGNTAIVFGVLEGESQGKMLYGAFKVEGDWCASSWGLDGRWLPHTYGGNDLMPPKRKFWVMWPDDLEKPYIFNSEEEAKYFASTHKMPFGEYEEP